jgi:hypothetical protein
MIEVGMGMHSEEYPWGWNNCLSFQTKLDLPVPAIFLQHCCKEMPEFLF